MIKIAFITDEATQDMKEAIHLAKTYGLQGLELRSVDNLPIDEIPLPKLQEYQRLLKEAGLEIPNLAGSFFKCNVDDGAISSNLEKLERLCDAADIFDCRYIRGFSFFTASKEQMELKDIARYFEEPLKILQKRQKVLLLEADPSVTTTNHKSLAKLLSILNNSCFGAIFDPGNDIYDPYKEIPFPDGYEAVKNYIRHIHIKDAVNTKEGKVQCVKIGDGLVNYPRLLRQLNQDGYSGWLSLETHYRKDVTLTEEQMRIPKGDVFSSGGMEAMVESIEALKTLLEESGKERE